MEDDVAIRVESVSKSFKLPHEKHNSIKNLFINGFRRKRTYEKQEVLKGVSFEIKKGEFFGIIGRNGSGKSTLLKLLAGIYSPNSGAVQVNGKLTPFIELGVGFNPELTGRENVFLNGALLGFSREEMESMYDEIVKFAELKNFMDQKLKNYSSGMQVRLAFSIAIRANTEILVLDEVLAVGDATFQQKCYDYFGELIKTKKTVVFVSHDLESVRRYCDRSALISKGSLVSLGKTSKVIDQYTDTIRDSMISAQKFNKALKSKKTHRTKLEKVRINSFEIKNPDDTIQNVFTPNENIQVCVSICADEAVEEPVVGFQVVDSTGRVAVATNTYMQDHNLGTLKKGETRTATFTFPNYLTNGTYKVSCAVNKEHAGQSYDRLDEEQSFVVTGFDFKYSQLHPPIELKVEKQ